MPRRKSAIGTTPRPRTLKVTPAITADYGAPVKARGAQALAVMMTAPTARRFTTSARTFAGVVRIKFKQGRRSPCATADPEPDGSKHDLPAHGYMGDPSADGEQT